MMRTKKTNKTKLRLILALLALLTVTLAVGCGALPDEDAYPTDEEPVEPEPSPTAKPEPSYEVAEDYSGSGTALGELEVEYPAVMQPQTSNSVIASVYIPDALVSADVSRYERVSISEERQLAVGDLDTYVTTILLAGAIRAEINSPTLTFNPAYPATQDVDLASTRTPTTWIWTVETPASAGTHTFVLSLFHGEETVPAWVGSFSVEVTAPVADVPQESNQQVEDQAEQRPFGELLNQLMGIFISLLECLTALLGFLAVLIPIIISVRDHQTGHPRRWWQVWRQ